MPARPRPRLSLRQASPFLAAALIALGVPAAAGAATAGEGPLSAELESLATPAVAAQPVPDQAEAVGLPAEGPGSLSREGRRVVVEARFGAGEGVELDALRAAGAKVLVADPEYATVALSVEPEDLGALAEVSGLASVTPALRPVVYDAEGAFGTNAASSESSCEGGSVISQGVAQLNVPAARTSFGARGAGITIGVISDSFNSATSSIEGGAIATRARNDEALNDLPGKASTCSGQQVPVNVIAEAPSSSTSESTDEGRAMLQIVHDVAPHAQLAFATALPSELAFAHNIERLAEPVSAGGAGAQVIVDDIGYLSEPFYQDGPVAVAIRKVTKEGVTYLSAAGNENVRDALGRNIGSWEAPAYRAVACPSFVTQAVGSFANACMNFKPSGGSSPTFGIQVAKGGDVEIDLQWAEAWYGVGTDLDAYLFSAGGELLSSPGEGEGDLNSTSVQKPIEVLGWENETGEAQEVLLVINRCSGTCNPQAIAGTPRLKFEFVGHGDGVTETEYPVSSGGDIVGPTIYGHAGAAATVSVGAIRYTESATAPKAPEYYSSRGPVKHYFGPVVGTSAAAALGEAEVLAKPDLTATDCASTNFFAQFASGAWHFCGTSEAAPHAAAVAALMKQTSPSASPAAILAAMKSSATKYTPASSANSPEAVGAGLLNAAGALSALGGSPVSDPPSSTVSALTEEPSPSPPLVPSESPSPSPAPSPSPVQPQPPTVVAAKKPDTEAPTSSFGVKPRKVVATSKRSILLRFALKASESPVTFYCQFDRTAVQVCPASFTRRFGVGSHLVKVKAKDAAGNLAGAWASYGFRVKLVRPAPSSRRR